MANNADFKVVLIPLRDEYRSKLDTEKAWSGFEKDIEGLPNGFPNFVFTWIVKVKDCFLLVTTNDFAELFFSVLYKIYPKAFDIFDIEALNFRINTTGLNLQQVVAEAARK